MPFVFLSVPYCASLCAPLLFGVCHIVFILCHIVFLVEPYCFSECAVLLLISRYFSGTDGYKRHVYNYWHKVLAGHFESVDDMDRKAEVSIFK